MASTDIFGLFLCILLFLLVYYGFGFLIMSFYVLLRDDCSLDLPFGNNTNKKEENYKLILIWTFWLFYIIYLIFKGIWWYLNIVHNALKYLFTEVIKINIYDNKGTSETEDTQHRS